MRRFIVTVIILGLLPVFAAGQDLTLKDIEMSINILGNGDVTVKEKRTMTVTNRLTEYYIVMDNMGDIPVLDFGVSDETGRQFALQDKWNINASREEKTGKCGIVTKGRGSYELCWGLGERVNGSKEKVFYVTYTLGSLVKAYYEADGFNHMFITSGLSQLPDTVNIAVTVENIPIDTTNARGWGFGHYGENGFENGAFNIHIGNYTYQSSAIVMIALRKGLIQPKDSISAPFQDVVDRAMIDSDYLRNGGGSTNYEREPWMFDEPARWFCSLLGIEDPSVAENLSDSMAFVVIGLFIAFFIYIKKIFNVIWYILSLKPLRMMIKRMKVKKKLSEITGGGGWVRALPFNGSIFSSQKALNSLSYINGNDINNAIGAYILRLFQRGTMAIVNDNGKEAIFIDEYPEKLKEDTNVNNSRDRELEDTLHYIFLSASGKDHILQEKELKRWMRSHPSYANKLLSLKDVQNGKDYTEVARMMGLMKFLKDFTLLSERHVVEVKLWDEYLVFATLFGIADKVRQDFRKVCPEYFQMSKFAQIMDKSNFNFSSTINSLAYATYHSARISSIAEARKSAYASFWDSSGSGGGGYRGTGGSSSYGGGGGYSGGGRGGGGR